MLPGIIQLFWTLVYGEAYEKLQPTFSCVVKIM